MSTPADADLPSPRKTTARQKARRVYVNMDPKQSPPNYTLNRVRTSKYTIFSFLPKNIFEQFHGLANFYFLSLVILQAFPQFKEVDILVTALPIIIIVAVTAIKDGLEDLKRHSADDGVNCASTYLLDNWTNRNYGKGSEMPLWKRVLKIIQWPVNFIVQLIYSAIILLMGKKGQEKESKKYPTKIAVTDYILRSSVLAKNSPTVAEESWKLSQWRDIRVGDFVLLRNNDNIPADMIIVSTGEPDSTCYVETKNLDGETNLKVRRGIPELSHIKTPEDCKKVQAFVDAEIPSPNLYTFNGAMTLKNGETEQVIPIGPSGLLLRGCILRNTSWLIGLVVYTGFDTKIMLNSGPTPSKRSNVDKQINPQVILNTVILCAMCAVCGILSVLYANTFRFGEVFYAGVSPSDIEDPLISGALSFFRCLIIYQNIIPIALYISLEVTKTVQSFLINQDLEMWDDDAKQSAQPKSWNLCDDLGQIEYIFSDKTGTLTSNTMDFKKCSINGVSYGITADGSTSSSQLHESKSSKVRDEWEIMQKRLRELFDTKYVDKNPSFVDSKLAVHLQLNGIQAMKIREFFSLLAVCHTVLVEKPDESNPNQIIYRAQSPDEAALVSAAKNVGFACLNRTDNKVEIDLMGVSRTYTILNIIEFNSDRKRMSVVVRRPEGDIVLLTKGADSVIYERLDRDTDRTLREETSSHLEMFANEGLRTLCLGYRLISEEEYGRWSQQYRQAQAALVDREKECDLIADLLERNLILMGATAIEDKLQDGVPDSIAVLAKAGIKLWVLTGDKVETAINIGFSCNLLQKSMILIVIQASDPTEASDQLKEALTRFWDSEGHSIVQGDLALVIDGLSLKFALEPNCKPLLLELGCRCKSVLCCRVSPLQKAMVVKLVREGLGAMCLAIGDGANDVSMIQEADIGIGISGKEGLQAVMASDYAISQFRFLSRLLLVHGRWAYVRSSELVLTYFYKNVVWLFILFWHQFYNGFSASLAMDFTYSMFFNTVFTFLTTMSVGIFDQDLKASISLLIPQSYLRGIRQELYSSERYWVYMAYGIYQSLVCYFGIYYISEDATLNARGFEFESFSAGTTMAYVAILVINIYSTVNWYSWTWITVFSLVSSLVFWIVYTLTYSPDVALLLTSPMFYAAVVLLTFVSLAPKMVIKYLQMSLYPTDTDVLLEYQKVACDNEAHHQSTTAPNDQKEESLKKTMTISKSADQLNREKQEFIPVMDGFGHSPVKPDTSTSPSTSGPTMKKSQSLNPHEIDTDRSRKSSFSGALRSGMTKIVKSFKGEPKTRVHRAGSLVYMGGKGEAVPNTGFAFSHDQGMADIITPRRAILEVISEEPGNDRRRRTSHHGKLRNFSRSIQSVFKSYTKSISSVNDEEKVVSPSASQDIMSNASPVQSPSSIQSISNHGPASPPPFVPLHTIPSIIDHDPVRTSDPGYQFHNLCVQIEDKDEPPEMTKADTAPPGLIDRELSHGESRSRAHSRTSRASIRRTNPVPESETNNPKEEASEGIPEIAIQPPTPFKPNSE